MQHWRFWAIVCTLVVLGLVGHGAVETIHEDHSEHGALVACLLLFTVFAPAAIAWKQKPSPAVAGGDAGLRPQRSRPTKDEGRARASPAVLQRFLT